MSRMTWLISLTFCSLQQWQSRGAQEVRYSPEVLFSEVPTKLGTAASLVTTREIPEQDLRSWWGNLRFAEHLHMVTQDKRVVAYELLEDLDHNITDAIGMALDKHLSGKPCTSLPVNVSLHAWRYNPIDMESCLNMGANEGSACTLRCRYFSSVSTTLSCSKTASGWSLIGSPPKGLCSWALDEEVIDTTGGLVQGLVRPLPWKWGNGSISVEYTRTFWGIRYAERPARFAVAQPVSERWSGVQSIDYYDLDRNDSLRMHCLDGLGQGESHGTEDCLFLDVYVPPGASAAAPRPVFFWIFAAGFIMGDAWQDGGLDSALLALRQDAVVIMVSSRAAALGHWAHPALSREYGDSSAGNIGERDQRQALRWVQNNIRAFGGDPRRVTIAGHSSGAFDAFFHVLSPQSQGLAHGAILESAALDSGWYWQNKEQAFSFYAELGEALGCPQDHGSGEQIVCLRSLPASAFSDLVSRQWAELGNSFKAAGLDTNSLWSMISALFGAIAGSFQPADLHANDSYILTNPMWPMLPYGLVVDGTDAGLPAAPRDLYEKGRIANMPIYLNHESDEGTLFAAMIAAIFPWKQRVSVTNDAVDSITKWAFGFNGKLASDLQRVYPRSWTRPAMSRLSRAITDSVFLCPYRRFARAVAKQRPGSVFWAEHTFFESNSSNLVSAIFHKDALWFLGANHCLPSSALLGSLYGGLATWSEATQKDHTIMNCHYALMVHCGSPGALPGTAACLPNAPAPIACMGLAEQDIYPFLAFDPSSEKRHQLHPEKHSPIISPPDEEDICDFWDAAPPMPFQSNSCRGCRPGESVVPAAMTDQAVIV